MFSSRHRINTQNNVKHRSNFKGNIARLYQIVIRSTVSQAYITCNNGIHANFVFPNIYSFLHVSKCEIRNQLAQEGDISKFQTSFVLLILNDTDKTKLAILDSCLWIDFEKL